MRVRLDKVRLAFPALFTAKAFGDSQDAAFSASFLLAPDHPAVKVLAAAMMQVAKEKWGPKADATFKQLKGADRLCLRDGAAKSDYQGFEGQLYVSARATVRPLVIDRDKSPLAATDGKPYAGCYVNAVLDVWAQDNKYGKRVNATLAGVQFVGDGEPFSGAGAASEDDFEPVVETAWTE